MDERAAALADRSRVAYVRVEPQQPVPSCPEEGAVPQNNSV